MMRAKFVSVMEEFISIIRTVCLEQALVKSSGSVYTSFTPSLREHNNYIVDSLGVAYPEMSNDDKYGTARNCVFIILAKIHTFEWTLTLLDNSVSTLGLHSNWYGFKNAVVDFLLGFH